MPPVISVVVAVGEVIVAGAEAGGIVGAVFTAGIMFGAQAAIGAVSSLFRHPASTKNNAASSQLSFREPISYRRVVYGAPRLGGIITDMGLAGANNDYLHMVVTLSGHKLHSIGNTIYLDGVAVPLTLSGGYYIPSSGKYVGFMWMEKDLGDPAFSGQPFPQYAAEVPGHWTANHKQQGCAKVHLKLKWDQNVWQNGVPSAIAFDLQGKEVYDPRTGLTGYSDNPALCVRDFLTDTQFGFGAAASELDDSTFIAAANTCDEAVSLKAGGSQTRYLCDGAFDSGTPRGDALRSLLTAMAGFIVPPGDLWRVFAGVYRDPVLGITDGDLRGPIKYDTCVSRRDLANGVKGTFISPSNNWEPSDFTPYQSATHLTEDGEAIWQDITLDFTTDDIRAQRLAKIHLEMLRRQNVLLLPCGMMAFSVQPGDTIEFTHDRFGFSAKTFMVMRTSLEATGDQGKPVLGVNLTCIPMDPAVYTWTPASDEQATISADPVTLPDMGTVQPPSGLALANVEVTRGDGIKQLQIRATWTSPNDIHVLSGGKIQVWYKPHSSGTWTLAGEADGADQSFYISKNVNDGSVYDVKICSLNSHRVQSSFVEVDNFTASATAATFGGTVSSLDNVNDGTTYGRTRQAVLTGGYPKRAHLTTALNIVGGLPTYLLPLWNADLSNFGSGLGAIGTYTGWTSGALGASGVSLVAGDHQVGTGLVDAAVYINGGAPHVFSVAGWFSFGAGQAPAGPTGTVVLVGRTDVAPAGTPSAYAPVLWVDNSGMVYAGTLDGSVAVKTVKCLYTLDWRRPHHLAVVRSSSQILLYVDGNLAASLAATAESISVTMPYWNIGAGYASAGWGSQFGAGTGWYTTGTTVGINAQDVCIWEGQALSGVSVQKLYHAGQNFKITDFAQGSIPPSINGSLTYTASTTGVTWTCSVTVSRADMTSTSVSGSIATTGLSPSTTYYFWPYLNDQSGNTNFGLVTGGGSAVGSPADAFTAVTQAAAQIQNQLAFVALSSGAMSAATPSSGSVGGSGGGGGRLCLRGSMLVHTRERGIVRLYTVHVGEHLLGLNDIWVEVLLLRKGRAETWLRLTFSNGEVLDVTPAHAFTLASGEEKRAQDLCMRDVIPADKGYVMLRKMEIIDEDDIKISVTATEPRTFLAGKYSPSVLTHNVQIVS